jgi:hypothetical protein
MKIRHIGNNKPETSTIFQLSPFLEEKAAKLEDAGFIFSLSWGERDGFLRCEPANLQERPLYFTPLPKGPIEARHGEVSVFLSHAFGKWLQAGEPTASTWEMAPVRVQSFRRFVLRPRTNTDDDDIVWGVLFPDGLTITHWRTPNVRGICMTGTLNEVRAVHRNGGKTELQFLDE